MLKLITKAMGIRIYLVGFFGVIGLALILSVVLIETGWGVWAKSFIAFALFVVFAVIMLSLTKTMGRKRTKFL